MNLLASDERVEAIIKAGGIISATSGIIFVLYWVFKAGINRTWPTLPILLISAYIFKASEDSAEMVKLGMYEEAKNKLIVPMAASLILGWVGNYFMIVGGLLLLLGYLSL